MKLNGLVVLCLSLVVAGLLLVGCGSNGGAGAAPSAGGGGAPTEGGILKVASGTDLDPPTFFTGTTTQMLVTGLVYDTLIKYPAQGLTPEPSLARSWQLSSGGKILTLQLRHDVSFQTGRKFTSKDVQFSIEQYADPRRAAQFQRTAAGVVGFDTSKPYEIKLTLAHPMSNILDLLSVVPILDRSTIKEFDSGKRLVGTGPFEFVSWTPGSRIVLKANRHYWGGPPHLEGVEVDVVPNPQTEVSQLRAGQVDGVLLATYVELRSLEASGQFQVLQLKGDERASYLGTNVENPALQDVRLRHAIADAIDRTRIAEDVYRGYAMPINLPWPEYSPAYEAQANQTYSLDQEKAKRLVAEIGTVPTLPLAYGAADSSVSATMAEILQSNLEEVGIPVKLEPLNGTQYLKDLIGGEFPALWISEHTFFQFNPSTLAMTAYPFNAESNTSNFKSPTYEAAATAAWEAPDPESPEAKKAYEEINKELLNEAFLIEIAKAPVIIALSPKVHGVTWTKQNQLDLDEAYLED